MDVTRVSLGGVLLAAGLLLGCGYRVVEGISLVGEDVTRVEIQMFENRSEEPGLEWMIGEALMEEFLRRGRLTPVHPGELSQFQASLYGVIQQVIVLPRSFSSVSISVEDSIRITVDVSIRRVDTGELVWQRSGLVAREEFLSSPDPLVYESNKEVAMLRVAALIAESIHNDLIRY